MARKTNKTSHVLNLITNGAPAEPEGNAPEAASGESGKGTAVEAGRGQEPAAMQNHTGDRKVIVVDASESDKISNEIRERLEEHVEQAESEAAAAGAEAAPESAATPEDTAAAEEPVSAGAEENAPEAENVSEETKEAAPKSDITPEETAAAGSAKKEHQPNYHMVNVMEQVLGRANLSEQMEKYGVCTCSRCCADVLALSLTKLPSKYVVVDGNPIAPIIGYYESKYRSRILTEIMKACILVKEKPRHKGYEVTVDMLK